MVFESMGVGGRIQKDMSDKRAYYDMGRVAMLLGENVSRIRYWIKDHQINCKRIGHGIRKLTPQQFEKIKRIQKIRNMSAAERDKYIMLLEDKLKI